MSLRRSERVTLAACVLLAIGTADRWAVALGAGTEPISRQFDPRFSAILKSAKS